MNEHNLNYYARNSPKIHKPPLKQPQSLLSYSPTKRNSRRQYSLHSSVISSHNHTLIQSCKSDNNQYIRIEDQSGQDNWNRSQNLMLIVDSEQEDSQFHNKMQFSLQEMKQMHLFEKRQIEQNLNFEQLSNEGFNSTFQLNNEEQWIVGGLQKQVKNQTNVQSGKKNLFQEQKTQKSQKKKQAIRHFSFGEKNQDIMKDIDLINSFADQVKLDIQIEEKPLLDSNDSEAVKYKKDVESDHQNQNQQKKNKNDAIFWMFTPQQKQKFKDLYGKTIKMKKSCLQRSSKTKRLKNIETMDVSAKDKKQLYWIQFLRMLHNNQFMKIKQCSQNEQSQIKLNQAFSMIASQNTNLSQQQRQIQSFSIQNQQHSERIRNTEDQIQGLSKIHTLTYHQSDLLQNQYNFFSENFEQQHMQSRRQSACKPILELIHYQYETSNEQSSNPKQATLIDQQKKQNEAISEQNICKNDDIANLTTSRGKEKKQIQLQSLNEQNKISPYQVIQEKSKESLDQLLQTIKQLPQEFRIQYLQIYDHYFLQSQKAKIKLKQQEKILKIMHCLVSLAKNHIRGQQYAITDIQQEQQAKIKMNQLIIQGLLRKLAFI